MANKKEELEKEKLEKEPPKKVSKKKRKEETVEELKEEIKEIAEIENEKEKTDICLYHGTFLRSSHG